MKYYAHSKTELNMSEWHLLKDHLEDTATLAAEFSAAFGAEKLGRLAGLLHDIGKYSADFQRRLEGHKKKVDHTSAGAFVANKNYGAYGRILAYTVAGHHCGLQDWGSKADNSTLEGRLSKKELPDYSQYQMEINLPKLADLNIPLKKSPIGQGFSGQFLIRFLYSCLVDADFLDTERALNFKQSSLRDNRFTLAELSSALEAHLKRKSTSAPDTPVNRRRAEILADCLNKACHEPGFFSLSVPTGGGKTLSSMAFAINHAITHGMKRVIYVIPYTSIIEQNAAVFKDIFGEERVLEHHSNFSYPGQDEVLESESEDDTQGFASLKLASENWDMPIVMTTNVQFFESLFSAKSSRCRKLHNIANSVVIIDEAQMIPTGYLRPCINALVELVANYNSTVVLCTATQPAINRLLPLDCTHPLEIVRDPDELYRAFQRVKVRNLGSLSDDILAEKLLLHDQVLCIVNSKKHARIVFEKIEDKGAFHLSTRMCPAHRSQSLQEVREKLKTGKPCRVVSTQLIEAGVDVDFPVVYRSSAGVDSIAQSAGRCNREGLRGIGDVYVFKPEKHGLPSGWLSRTATIGDCIFRRHEDPLNLEAVKEYFSELYKIEGEGLDKEGIMAEIAEQAKVLKFPFRTIADKFKLIDDQNTTAVVIPYDEQGREILDRARWSKFPSKYIRRLQKYSVQVYEQEFREMLQIGLLENIGGRFYVLSETAYKTEYSPKLGLLPCTESMLLNANLII